MTLDLLSMLAGALLSLAFSYIPSLRNKFDTLLPEVKRLVMLGLLVVVAGGVYGLACAGWLASMWPGASVTCDQRGVLELVKVLILALIANQSTYMISPLKTVK
jgi:hypothetical protein